jgi:hypothetical protein
MERNALISPNGVYRYWLSRRWEGRPAPLMAWVMLNPSTADATVDDPTIRRVMHFSRREGYAGCLVMNLFALRTPDSSQLRRHPNPVGVRNDRFLQQLARKGDSIVVAWGSKALPARVHEVLNGALKDAHLICLGKTGHGYPRHPLYLPNDTWFRPFP